MLLESRATTAAASPGSTIMTSCDPTSQAPYQHGRGGGSGSSNSSGGDVQEQVRKLLLQVRQRDSEIAALLGMLRAGTSDASPAVAAVSGSSTSPTSPSAGAGTGTGTGYSSLSNERILPALLDTRLLVDRHRAFEAFSRSYQHSQARCMYAYAHHTVDCLCPAW